MPSRSAHYTKQPCPAQRVGVFIDIQNMYYSGRNLFNKKVNFGHILEDATGDRQLIRAIAYVIRAEAEQEASFFEALNKMGFEVRAKDLQTFLGGAKKGDWDVGIAMDMMRIAPKLDVAVLVSGDGDFVDLLQHMKALGCRTEVMAFGGTSSSKLVEEAHSFVDLGKNQTRYLISK